MSTFDDEKRMQPFMDEWYRKKGATNIDRSQSCKQFDVIVTINGYSWKIEEKFLFTDTYDQGLVEIIQDMNTNDPGWFYHLDCHTLLWIYCGLDNGRNGKIPKPPIEIHSIKWPHLKNYILERWTEETWATFQICPKHYGTTLNYPVDWYDLQEKNISIVYPGDYYINKIAPSNT